MSFTRPRGPGEHTPPSAPEKPGCWFPVSPTLVWGPSPGTPWAAHRVRNVHLDQGRPAGTGTGRDDRANVFTSCSNDSTAQGTSFRPNNKRPHCRRSLCGSGGGRPAGLRPQELACSVRSCLGREDVPSGSCRPHTRRWEEGSSLLAQQDRPGLTVGRRSSVRTAAALIAAGHAVTLR